MRPSPKTRREKSRLIEEGPEAAEEEEGEVEAEASGVVEDVEEEEDSRPDLLTVGGELSRLGWLEHAMRIATGTNVGLRLAAKPVTIFYQAPRLDMKGRKVEI
ncbi:MAG: hypothetical protein Q9204_008741 [Flavoplaca sp. TL-2023a]